MSFKFYTVLCLLISIGVIVVSSSGDNAAKPLIVELSDDKWDQIQKGQWLVGFFDKDTKESARLEEDWHIFAIKCKAQNINVARAYSSETPGLHVRFLVTDFPKVFYIKNGVAHEVLKANRQTLVDLIKGQNWDKLKAVNFLSNPFSVQMSLLSFLFVHAVSLYNYENSLVQKFVPFTSATDVAFGLTFIIVGTFLGLLLTCAFGIIHIFLIDPTDCEEEEDINNEKEEDIKKQSDNEDENEVKDTSEESSNIRKRK